MKDSGIGNIAVKVFGSFLKSRNARSQQKDPQVFGSFGRDVPKNLLVSNYSQIYNYFEFTESRNLFLSASMLDGWRIIEGTTTVEPTYPGRNHSCFHHEFLQFSRQIEAIHSPPPRIHAKFPIYFLT